LAHILSPPPSPVPTSHCDAASPLAFFIAISLLVPPSRAVTRNTLRFWRTTRLFFLPMAGHPFYFYSTPAVDAFGFGTPHFCRLCISSTLDTVSLHLPRGIFRVPPLELSISLPPEITRFGTDPFPTSMHPLFSPAPNQPLSSLARDCRLPAVFPNSRGFCEFFSLWKGGSVPFQLFPPRLLRSGDPPMTSSRVISPLLLSYFQARAYFLSLFPCVDLPPPSRTFIIETRRSLANDSRLSLNLSGGCLTGLPSCISSPPILCLLPHTQNYCTPPRF